MLTKKRERRGSTENAKGGVGQLPENLEARRGFEKVNIGKKAIKSFCQIQ